MNGQSAEVSAFNSDSSDKSILVDAAQICARILADNPRPSGTPKEYLTRLDETATRMTARLAIIHGLPEGTTAQAVADHLDRISTSQFAKVD